MCEPPSARRIAVLSPHRGLGGIIHRLFSDTHAVADVQEAEHLTAEIARGTRFEAIVCDTDNGHEVRRRLSEIDAEQAKRTLLILPWQAGPLPDGCLARPFMLAELERAIRSLLAMPSPTEAVLGTSKVK